MKIKPGYYIDYTHNLMIVYPSGEFDIVSRIYTHSENIRWTRMIKAYLRHWMEDAVFLDAL